MKEKGVSLIAAIAVIVVLSIFSVSAAMLLGVTSRGSSDYIRSSQAFGSAQAGINWYLMRLSDSSISWASSTSYLGISISPWVFDVTVSNVPWAVDSSKVTKKQITSVGKTKGADGVTIQRTMSQWALKMPKAVFYAIFWGRNTGSLNLIAGTTISGEMWARGPVVVSNGASATKIYHPDITTVSGGGTYTHEAVASPYPTMPVLNTAYYDNLITSYDAIIAANASNTDINQTTNLTLNGNTINCRNFNTNGNITISGYGVICANLDINLHIRNADSGTLNILPSGGNIIMLAKDSITVNSGQADTAVNSSVGLTLYAASTTSANNDLITIGNDTTNLAGALVIAKRHIQVYNSANLAGSTLYVGRASTNTQNLLEVTGSGTTVGNLVSPCTIISSGSRNPAISLASNASVVGLVYQRDTGVTPSGTMDVGGATVSGMLVCDAFSNNRINGGNITYDANAIPDPPPEGFEGFASIKPDTWDGI